MRIKWLLLLLLVSLHSVVNADAADKQQPKFRVLTSDSHLFSEVDAQGQVSGFTVSLVEGVLSKARIEAKFEALPFAKVVSELNAQKHGVISILARTPERENDYYWITPITANPVALFVRADSPFSSQENIALADVSSISVVSGDYRETILQNHEVSNIVAVDDWAQAITSTLSGESQGLFFSQMGLALICKYHNLQCDQLEKVLLWDTAYSYIVLPKTVQNSELAAKLTVAASEYKASPQYAKLIEKMVPQLQKYLPDVNVEEGIISFVGNKQLGSAKDLWVIADLVPFFAEMDSRGNIVGYIPDLVRKILHQAGLEQQILAAPWERIVREAQSKSNVLAFAVARTPDREDLFHWLTPVTRNMHALFGIDGKTYTSLSDIPRDKKIATLRSDYRTEVSMEAGLTTIEFDSWGAAMAAILSGEADYIFGSQGGVQVGCKEIRKACRQVDIVMPHRYVTAYVVLSKSGTQPELVERLKNASVIVKQSTDYKRWAQQWSENAKMKKGLEQHVENGVINLWRAGR
ncbi:substrate-binding periplasmic protein [Alteromonas ponticola]|uniref:Transporter substrate-binding domain-containing protein n=1 Tax=Alteromonas ponticola TaxID=2720613 RepID=A0ABX1R6V6_9ALTE|nr:transporter substrate-binding domain-containing protein [Alteromonas ponticola]NMH60955.1 transporter substrate-binding domain-containing protein [Alteromonas ponticola]